LKLGFAGMPLTLGADAAKAIEHEVKFMEALSKHLELEAPQESKATDADEIIRGRIGHELRSNDPEATVTRAALERFLQETAPDNYRARQWGSLSRVRLRDNSYRWLCTECAKRSR
jgi:hypothetical protein